MPKSHPSSYQDAIFIRLFRLWAMARETHQSPLPGMYAEADRHGFEDQTASACASLFELVENQVGRELRRECCCSAHLTSDERALIGVLRSAPTLQAGSGSRAVPHGLLGAICWAAKCACDAMGIRLVSPLDQERDGAANKLECPFQISKKGKLSHGF